LGYKIYRFIRAHAFVADSGSTVYGFFRRFVERRRSPSYILQRESLRVLRVHYNGGFAGVSDGECLRYPAAAKHLKANERSSDRIFKACLRSTSRVFLGISVSTNSHCFRIPTEWMPNADLMRCTGSNPEANHSRFVSPLAVSLSPLSCSLRAFSSLRSSLV